MADPPRLSRGESGPLAIFIGSGDASAIERKVLIYSLHKHTHRPLDIRVFNGTDNALERDGGIEPLPLAPNLRHRHGATEFGLCRYLVPQLCGWIGRALYLDSDIVCLGDVGDLFDVPLAGADFLALPRHPPADDGSGWLTAVMPIDCASARFDLESIFDEIGRGLYTQGDFMKMSARFLARHPYRIGRIDPAWNSLDVHGSGTKLVHFTDLDRQPWRRPGHAYGAIWFRYFREACAAHWISAHDIDRSLRSEYVRPDLRAGFGWREWLTAALARVR